MKAEKFWMEFKNMFRDGEFLEKAKNCWKNRADFTKFILPHISERILEKNGFEGVHQYEYYKIDLIGWRDKRAEIQEAPTVDEYTLKKHFWYLGAAIEHENDQTDWTDELVKLLYINCPLRVVIGYVPERLLSRSSDKGLSEVLDYASGILSKANRYGDLVRKDQEYLLILGKNHGDASELGEGTYSAFLYNGENGFVNVDKPEERS